MKHETKTAGKFLASCLIIALAILAISCKSSATTSTTTASITTLLPAPAIVIIAPTGTQFAPGKVTVSVQVTGIDLVNKPGQPNVAGEGHIHYFLDVDPPTAPGQPAVTTPGSYAATADTSYTWTNVPSGQHKLSVELVNNDHTPLVPAVTASMSLLIIPEIGPPNIVIKAPLNGGVLPAGPLTVTAEVTNFNLVDKLGQANAQREGHIHYFIDVEPPMAQGQPAVTAAGTYAPTASTSYTWPSVSSGTHKLSVELVNNDHTPLNPPVVATVTVTVAPGAGSTPASTAKPTTSGY
jgi:hypothetical protein